MRTGRELFEAGVMAAGAAADVQLQLLQQPGLIAVTHEELRRAVQVLMQLPARRAGGRQYRPETLTGAPEPEHKKPVPGRLVVVEKYQRRGVNGPNGP